MNITTSTGTMILNDDEIPTTDDMNEIISSVTRNDDDGAQFQRLCDASTQFPAGLTCWQFEVACKIWLDNHEPVPTP
jgi:hypothetical protein